MTILNTAGPDAPGLDGSSAAEGAISTLRRGLRLSPEFRAGLAGTIALALVSTAGRVVVPIAVQQTIDKGVGRPGGPDLAFIRRCCCARWPCW